MDCLDSLPPVPGVATKNTAMMSSLIVPRRDSMKNLFDCGTGRVGALLLRRSQEPPSTRYLNLDNETSNSGDDRHYQIKAVCLQVR